MAENTSDQPKTLLRKVRDHVTHDAAHISSLVGLHIVALAVLEKTPLLHLLWLH